MAEYITKKQVIEWFRPYGHTEEGISFDVLKTDITDMPAADVAPVVQGRWEEADWLEYDAQSCETILYPKAAIVCTNCRCAFKKDALRTRNYCPNCGAKMDGEA